MTHKSSAGGKTGTLHFFLAISQRTRVMLVQRATLGELLLKGSQARPYYNQVKDAQDRTVACYGDAAGPGQA